MRKLATIRKIDEILPIEGADAIETAVVGGWKVVVKKNEFKVDSLAIYIEIDSWVPTELAPFLSKGNEPRMYNGVRGERLKTIRLRGQLSQGLLLPINNTVLETDKVNVDVDYITDTNGVYIPVYLDDDVTEHLGIQKWEAPMNPQMAGVIRGNFPSAIPKTDQERIQNLREQLIMWNDPKFTWEVTEKIHGTSCTMYLDMEGIFHVCSRNLDLKFDENNLYWKMAIANKVEEKLINRNLLGFAVQGEIIGEGIEKNYYKIKGQRFFVFDIYTERLGEYMSPMGRRTLSDELMLDHVPILHRDFQINHTMDEMLKFSEGKSVMGDINGPENEGKVFKCNGFGKPSFKVVSNKFLMKVGE